MARYICSSTNEQICNAKHETMMQFARFKINITSKGIFDFDRKFIVAVSETFYLICILQRGLFRFCYFVITLMNAPKISFILLITIAQN